MKIYIGLFVLCVVITLSILLVNRKITQSEENAKQIEIRSKQREMEYDSALRYSEKRRLAAEDSLVVVLARASYIHRQDSISLVKQSKIKGSFNSLDSKQLQEQMITEFNKNK